MMKIGYSALVAFLIASCASQNSTNYRSQFNVVRDGVNVDNLILQCLDAPASAGFETTEACMEYAGTLMDK